jgi:hypothetical protein
VADHPIPGLTIDAEYRGAMFNAIHTGRMGGAAVLVTSGPSQRRPLDELRSALAPAQAFARPGGGGLLHLLVEERPPGKPLAAIGSVEPDVAARLLGELAARVADVHAAGSTVLGLHPDLVFADTDAAGVLGITGMAPQTMRFLVGMPAMRGGLCLGDVYLPREVWVGQTIDQDIGPAADVFALCALGYFLVTGGCPFPDLRSVLAGTAPRWTDVPLASVLADGLAADPEDRPSLPALRAALGFPGPPRKKPWFKFW